LAIPAAALIQTSDKVTNKLSLGDTPATSIKGNEESITLIDGSPAAVNLGRVLIKRKKSIIQYNQAHRRSLKLYVRTEYYFLKNTPMGAESSNKPHSHTKNTGMLRCPGFVYVSKYFSSPDELKYTVIELQC